MKKGVLILLSVLLATVIIYGGSGINVYFSCDNICCSRNGAVILSARHYGNKSGEQQCGCCNFHAKKRMDCHPLPSTTNGDDSHQKACKIERVTVNWQTAQSEKLIVDPASFNLISDFIQFIPNNVDATRLIMPWQLTVSQKPPDLSRDVYFSLLNILII